jgi:hypothetical protein
MESWMVRALGLQTSKPTTLQCSNNNQH